MIWQITKCICFVIYLYRCRYCHIKANEGYSSRRSRCSYCKSSLICGFFTFASDNQIINVMKRHLTLQALLLSYSLTTSRKQTLFCPWSRCISPHPYVWIIVYFMIFDKWKCCRSMAATCSEPNPGIGNIVGDLECLLLMIPNDGNFIVSGAACKGQASSALLDIYENVCRCQSKIGTALEYKPHLWNGQSLWASFETGVQYGIAWRFCVLFRHNLDESLFECSIDWTRQAWDDCTRVDDGRDPILRSRDC